MRRHHDDPDDDLDDAPGQAEADAALRFGASLLLALLLAAPALWATAEGRRDVEYAALRLLTCFVAARLGLGLVAHLYQGYRQQRDLHAATGAGATDGPAGRSVLPGPMNESR